MSVPDFVFDFLFAVLCHDSQRGTRLISFHCKKTNKHKAKLKFLKMSVEFFFFFFVKVSSGGRFESVRLWRKLQLAN